MCRILSNLFKIILSTFFLSLSLQAADYDFNLPNNSFDHLSSIGLTKTIVVKPAVKYATKVTSQVHEFVIDHPKITAVVVGGAIGFACLASQESSLRRQECASFSASRPSPLAVPFQHGLRPYFVGTMFGSAAGVVARSAKLKHEARSLIYQAKTVAIDVHSNNIALKCLVMHSQGLKSSAQRATQQAGVIEAGMVELRKGILALSLRQANTATGLSVLDAGAAKLESGMTIVKKDSGRLVSDMNKLDRLVRSVKNSRTAGTGEPLQ